MAGFLGLTGGRSVRSRLSLARPTQPLRSPPERHRQVAAVGGETPRNDDLSLSIDLDVKSFAPDNGEHAEFSLRLEGGREGDVFVTARVYSMSGELVRVLFRDERRSFDRFTLASSERWDGTDRRGDVVPGGVYVVGVTWGVARGALTGSAKAALAVVR